MSESLDGYRNLIDLMEVMDAYADHPELFYHQLLDIVVRTVEEATLGTVCIVTGSRWRYVATVGHDPRELFGLEFVGEWDHPDDSDVVLPTTPGLDPRIAESERFEILRRAFWPHSACLGAGYRLSADTRIVVTVETEHHAEPAFSPDSRAAFRSMVRFAGLYHRAAHTAHELRESNYRLAETNRQVSALSDKLQRMLDLTSQLADYGSDGSTYLNELLRTALLVVEEADYGSVSVIQGAMWRFVAAVGHDLNGLSALPLKAEWVVQGDGTHVVERLVDRTVARMPEELARRFRQATRPISSSALLSLDVTEGNRVLLALDIAAGSTRSFAANTDRVIAAFASMASSFLRMRLNADAMNRAYLGFVNKLALLAEAHDLDTAAHNRRVARISSEIARAYGCDAETVRRIRDFAPLHDIGKLFIDTSLIRKTGKLEAEEYRVVQRHTEYAAELLDDPWFETARNIALHHHEHFDGTGYPLGLSGASIPIEAQIVGVADVFDALRSRRSYKQALPAQEVLQRMRAGDERMAPGCFNPRVLAALERALPRIEEMSDESWRIVGAAGAILGERPSA